MKSSLPRTRALARAIRLRYFATRDGGDASRDRLEALAQRHYGYATAAQRVGMVQLAAQVGQTTSALPSDPGGAAEFLAAVQAQEILARLPGALDAPLKKRLAAALELTLSEVTEGAGIPVHASTINGFFLNPVKTAGLTVLSNELLESANADRVLQTLLLRAAVRGSDSVFLGTTGSGILNGVTPVTYSGGDVASITFVIHELLASLTGVTDYENVVFVCRPSVAVALALLRDSTFGMPFSGVTAKGGTLAGLPLFTTPGAPANALIALDGSAVARNVNDGALTVRLSDAASLAMRDDPVNEITTPTGETVVSMFTTESQALRVVREIAFEVVRDNAVGYVANFTPGAEIVTA